MTIPALCACSLLLLGLTLCPAAGTGTETKIDFQYQCTRKCTVDDAASDCWRQSLGFYTEQLEVAIQQYVGTLTYISRWNTRMPKSSEYDVMARALVASVIGAAQRKETLEPLDADNLMAVFDLIMNKTHSVVEHYNDPEVMPVSFPCPVPCNYYPHIWMSLFFVTLAALLLLCIAFCLYLAHLQLRMDRVKQR